MLSQPEHLVHELRHVLLWPLLIEPGYSGSDAATIRATLSGAPDRPSPWSLLADEFTANPDDFQDRHYKEFVTFLPYVQRFLYGESRSARRSPDDPPSDASVVVFRRHDVAHLRVVLQEGMAPLQLDIAHVDLYLFQDLDIAILNVELIGRRLSLTDALDLLHRFGRAYPAGWDEHGNGLHNTFAAEWLGADGEVLVASDSAHREKYLSYVCQHRAPAVASHWDYLLRPLILDQSDEVGEVRYRLIEVYRMPFMAYLALDNPRALSRDDFLRLAMVAQLRRPTPCRRCRRPSSSSACARTATGLRTPRGRISASCSTASR